MTLTRKCGIIKVSIAEIGENIEDVRIEENNKSNLAMKKVIR